MISLNASRQDHWDEHARQWAHIGPPLRPAHEDLAILKNHLHLPTGVQPPAGTALLLGVTPELASLVHDLLGFQTIAVDRSLPMINSVWAAHSQRSMVIQGDWCHLPVAAETIDMAIGDGCFTTISFPHGYRQVLSAINHALRPDGIFSMRFFAAPITAESLDNIFSDLYAGAIENFHIFKWRLAMALLDRETWNIPVHMIWQAWHETVPRPDDLARHLDWPSAVVKTIDAYRDSPAIYSFPALPVLQKVLEEYFCKMMCFTPAYALGDRCPTIILRKK